MSRLGGSGIATDASRSAPGVDAVLALEAVAARSWPAPDTERVHGWLLRAAGGFTGRANSAVPLTREAFESTSTLVGGGLPVLEAVGGWYAERGLPTLVALPVPAFAGLHQRLLSEGWTTRGPTVMMTAVVHHVLAACPPTASLPPPRVASMPDPDWLRVYGRAGATVAPGRDVVAGGGARFATVELDGRPAAIARWTVEADWVGLSSVQVTAAHRRRGLATHLAAAAMADASVQGATRAWLQVEGDNEPAVALYRRLGFQVHHEYWYDRCPDDGEQP